MTWFFVGVLCLGFIVVVSVLRMLIHGKALGIVLGLGAIALCLATAALLLVPAGRRPAPYNSVTAPSTSIAHQFPAPPGSTMSTEAPRVDHVAPPGKPDRWGRGVRRWINQCYANHGRAVVSGLTAFAIAALLYLGYLFLDASTRGQFTWSIRIMSVLTFAALWAAVSLMRQGL